MTAKVLDFAFEGIAPGLLVSSAAVAATVFVLCVFSDARTTAVQISTGGEEFTDSKGIFGAALIKS